MSDYKHREVDSTNPPHYRDGERETIDEIRDALSEVAALVMERGGVHTRHDLADLLFASYCEGNRRKYVARMGKKGPAEADQRKAAWYCQMMGHAVLPDWHHDPRSVEADNLSVYEVTLEDTLLDK